MTVPLEDLTQLRTPSHLFAKLLPPVGSSCSKDELISAKLNYCADHFYVQAEMPPHDKDRSCSVSRNSLLCRHIQLTRLRKFLSCR